VALRAGAGHAQGIAHIGEPGRLCGPSALVAVALEGDRAVGGRRRTVGEGCRRPPWRGGEAAYDEGPLHELEALGVEQDHPLSQRATPPAARRAGRRRPAVVTGEATSCRYVGLGAIDGHQTVADLDTLVSYDWRAQLTARRGAWALRSRLPRVVEEEADLPSGTKFNQLPQQD